MADLKSNARRAYRDADAAENGWSRRTTVAHEVARKDIVLGIDELPRLAVAPPVCANARADIGLNRFIVAERDQPNRRGERHNAKFQRLLDVGVVLVHQICVKRGHRSLIEAKTQTAFDMASETEEPFRAGSDV